MGLGLGLLRSEEEEVVVVGGERGYEMDRVVHWGWLRSGWAGVVCRVVGDDEDVVRVVVVVDVVLVHVVVAWRIQKCMAVAVVLA